MITTHEEYLVDENGKKKAVVIPVGEWKRIQEEMGELDDIRFYDEVKSEPSDPVPFGSVVEQIRQGK